MNELLPSGFSVDIVSYQDRLCNVTSLHRFTPSFPRPIQTGFPPHAHRQASRKTPHPHRQASRKATPRPSAGQPQGHPRPSAGQPQGHPRPSAGQPQGHPTPIGRPAARAGPTIYVLIRPVPPLLPRYSVRSPGERTDDQPGASPANAARRAAPAPYIVGPALAAGLAMGT